MNFSLVSRKSASLHFALIAIALVTNSTSHAADLGLGTDVEQKSAAKSCPTLLQKIAKLAETALQKHQPPPKDPNFITREIDQRYINKLGTVPLRTQSSNKVSINEIFAEAAKYPDHPHTHHALAGRLVLLRGQIRQRGYFLSRDEELEYYALEEVNRSRKILKDDFHGIAFTNESFRFQSLSREEKKDFLMKFADSQHKDFDRIMRQLLVEETVPEIQKSIRQILTSRGISIDYGPYLESLLNDVNVLLPPGVRDNEAFKYGLYLRNISTTNASILELRSVTDEQLALLIAKSPTAALGFHSGRPDQFLVPFLNSPKGEVRMLALLALRGKTSEGAYLATVAMLKDPVPQIRAIAVENMTHIRDKNTALAVWQLHRMETDPRVLAITTKYLEPYYKPALEKGDVLWTATRERNFTTGTIGDIDLIRGPEQIAESLKNRFGYYSHEQINQVLQHNDPRVKVAVLEQMTKEQLIPKPETLDALMKDSVYEVRVAVVDLLMSRAKDGDQGAILALHRMAKLEENADITEIITAGLTSNVTSAIHTKVNRPIAEITTETMLNVKSSAPDGNSSANRLKTKALHFAGLIYRHPEPEMHPTPEDMRAAMVNFYQRIHPDYQLQESFLGPNTGLKAAILEPKKHAGQIIIDSENPLVLSFGGSEANGSKIKAKDWQGNLNYGTGQISSIEFNLIKQKMLKYLKENPNNRLLITGHSLGGALSQAMGHDLIAELGPEAAARIQIITWNGLSGLPALRILGRFRPDIAAMMDVENFRSSWDVVSNLGPTIGRLSHMQGIDGFIEAGGIKAMGNSHLMTTLEKLATYMQGIENAKVYKPGWWERIFNSLIQKLGRLASALYGKQMDARIAKEFESEAPAVLKLLVEARKSWAEHEGAKFIHDPSDFLKGEIDRVGKFVYKDPKEFEKFQSELEREVQSIVESKWQSEKQ